MVDAISNNMTRAVGFAVDNTVNINNTLRYILTFSGSEKGLLSSPFLPSGDFEIEVEFSINDFVGVRTFFCGASASNNSIIGRVNGGNINFFAYVGGTIQSLISVAVPTAGKIHTALFNISGTTASISINGGTPTTATWGLDGSQDVSHVGVRAGSSAEFIGKLLSVKFNDQSGSEDVIVNYVLDSGSIVEQFARGEYSPSGAKITFTNVVASDWEKFKYMQNPNQWKALDGSPILEII